MARISYRLFVLEQCPVTVLDLNHDPATFVEAAVIGGRHVVDALSGGQLMGAFQGIAQGGPERRGSRGGHFAGNGNGALKQQASVVSVGAEGRWFAAIEFFVLGDVIAGDGFGRAVRSQLLYFTTTQAKPRVASALHARAASASVS